MGFFTNYNLSGRGPSNRFLSASEKEFIQDLIFDYGVDDLGTSHSPDDSFIMSFADTSFGAYGNVRGMLTDYTRGNPGVTLDLEYADEAELHQILRFRDGEVEEIPRVEFYAPFTKLTLPDDDDNRMPVLSFRFMSRRGSMVTQLLVLYDGWLSNEKIREIEDGVAALAERRQNNSYEQFVHDVLNGAGVVHWIIKPRHTFEV